MASSYKQKVSELQGMVDAASKKTASKEKCFPMMMAAGVAAPIIVWGTMFFLQPSFVQKKEGGKSVRDNKKVFYWTALITVILWVAMYLFTYCRGYSNASMICSKR